MSKATRFSRRTFGRAVRRARKQIGLSQEDFAEHAGIHRTYVSSIELGKVSVGIDVANKSDTPRRAGGLMSGAASKAVTR